MTLSPGVSDASAQRPPARDIRGLPAADPIAGACRGAAARLPGRAHVASPEVTPAGVRVRLWSPGHARHALQVLHALGYQAAAEPGGRVMVTGWSTGLLIARAVRLETAASLRALEPADRASSAIARFQELRAGGRAEEPAVASVAAEARLTALEPCLACGHLPAPVADDDRRQARGEVRDLLERVAEGEAAVSALAGYAARVSEAAVRLFLAERDLLGRDEESAAATAASKAAEMHGPPPCDSLSVIDPATGKVRVLARPCGTCLTRKDSPLGADTEKVIQRNLDAGALLICHSTLPWGPYPWAAPAVCAGFWARHAPAVAAGRLALALGITRVPVPGRAPGLPQQSPDLSPGA